MSEDIGFKSYVLNGFPVYEDEKTSKLKGQCLYFVDTSFMKLPEYKPAKKRSFIEEIKHRISHAWYALNGGECD